MRRLKIPTPKPDPQLTVELPFLVSASELRDRKIKRRQVQDSGPGHSEAIQLVEIEMKKGK
jgi:hypothetical protein